MATMLFLAGLAFVSFNLVKLFMPEANPFPESYYLRAMLIIVGLIAIVISFNVRPVDADVTFKGASADNVTLTPVVTSPPPSLIPPISIVRESSITFTG